MSGKLLLDTNIIIGIFNLEAQLLSQIQGNEIFIFSIVLGELYFGAYKSARTQENLARINDLIIDYPLLKCDENTAIFYGQIKHELKVKGHPIPENDIWIAAVAMQHDLILVTRDEHFAAIDSIRLEKW